MASFLNNILGKSAGGQAGGQAAQADSDFADFGNGPSLDDVATPPGDGGASLADAVLPAAADKPYTKWYNIHERHSLQEFWVEGYILLMVSVILACHILGSRRNRSKAKAWMRAHAPLLRSEFSSVGINGVPSAAATESQDDGSSLLVEKSLYQFQTYATGRANVAFVDVNISLTKRFNPILNAIEFVLGSLTDGFPVPRDTVDTTLYPFDGRESKIVPPMPGTDLSKVPKSTYDGFVLGLVHKDIMKKLRDDRYDVSLTVTKDSSKLPPWLVMMTEVAEISDTFLTPELVEAAKKAGDLFEYLIISDQPLQKPTTIEETVPKKRVSLRYRIPSDNNYADLIPLFTYVLRLPDLLVKQGRFAPKVASVLRKTRDKESAELERAKKQAEDEERRADLERVKKVKRDEQLKAMDAKGQKKFLEKEREKEMKKSQKKGVVRG